MCEYCEKGKNISDAFFGLCKIKVFERTNKEKIYTLETDNDYVEINYCPMCGRKLGE